MSQWLQLALLYGKRDGAGSNLGMFFFVFFFCVCFFFFFRSLFFLSMYVWKSDEGFVHFLHNIAKSPSAFPK